MHIVIFSKLPDKEDLKEYKPSIKMELKEPSMSLSSMHHKMIKSEDLHRLKSKNSHQKSYNLNVQYASKLNLHKDSSSNAIMNSIMNV